MMRSIVSIIVLGSLSLSLTSCLKSRAQVRDDSYDDHESKPVAAHPVQDVQPQGGQYVIDELKSEFTRLEGRVEDLERAQKSGGNKSDIAHSEEFKKIEERIQKIEHAQASLTESLGKRAESSAADAPEIYKKAAAHFEEGDFEAALEGFTAYLKTPKPKRPEDATFLKAESLYKLKQYKKAIVEYSKFPEKFTKSTHMPESLYKIGLCFDALGMKEDAKGFYQELVEKYPKSPEAKKARKRVK
jgi:tol-pal system protein YbgF